MDNPALIARSTLCEGHSKYLSPDNYRQLVFVTENRWLYMIHNGYRLMSSKVVIHVPWLISLFRENTLLVRLSKVAVFLCFICYVS